MSGSETVGMVLCAGLGTRLRPLTDRLPKPAAPVCGLPLVRYALARMAATGIRRVVVNTHHLPEAMEQTARDAAEQLGLILEVSREPAIAGTGGALREARHLLAGAEAIVIWNGDILFDLALEPVLEAHRASRAVSTMVLMEMPAGESYPAVEVDGEGAVRRIAGRFGPGGKGLVPRHFTGVHVVSPALLDVISAEPYECDIRQVYGTLMDGRLRSVLVSGYWNDLGTLRQYLKANLELLGGGGPARLPGADPFRGMERAGRSGIWCGPEVLIDARCTVEPPVLIGARTIVEAGAHVGPNAIVGADCHVGSGARVRDAVLWAGTRTLPGETIVCGIAAQQVRAVNFLGGDITAR